MHADSFHKGPIDEMDAAARREFFGAEERRKTTSAPAIVPLQGNGIDRPVAPDPTSDRPFSTRDSTD